MKAYVLEQQQSNKDAESGCLAQLHFTFKVREM